MIPEPTRDEMLGMVEAMHKYGGGFVKALAECFTLADSNNKTRLYRAFPEYVKQYTEWSKGKAQPPEPSAPEPSAAEQVTP